jgi:hypothetical protein
VGDRQPVSRVLSTYERDAHTPDGHSSRRSVTRTLQQPTRNSKATSSHLLTRKWALLLFGLAPNGGYLAAASLQTPVVSYTAFSPLPFAGHALIQGLPRKRRTVSVALSDGLLHPGRYPALCSVECGLSSMCIWHTAVP